MNKINNIEIFIFLMLFFTGSFYLFSNYSYSGGFSDSLEEIKSEYPLIYNGYGYAKIGFLVCSKKNINKKELEKYCNIYHNKIFSNLNLEEIPDFNNNKLEPLSVKSFEKLKLYIRYFFGLLIFICIMSFFYKEIRVILYVFLDSLLISNIFFIFFSENKFLFLGFIKSYSLHFCFIFVLFLFIFLNINKIRQKYTILNKDREYYVGLHSFLLYFYTMCSFGFHFLFYEKLNLILFCLNSLVLHSIIDFFVLLGTAFSYITFSSLVSISFVSQKSKIYFEEDSYYYDITIPFFIFIIGFFSFEVLGVYVEEYLSFIILCQVIIILIFIPSIVYS